MTMERTSERTAGDACEADGRAVSEVIGYVIILGIVFTVFGLIFVNATSLFSATGETERLENAERGFVVLQSNVDDIVYGDAPRRTTDVQLGGGSVGIDNSSSRVSLTVDGEEVRNRPLSTVSYTLGDEGVSYENGAVFRESVGSATMVREPGWVIRDDYVAVSGVRTFGSGSRGGDGFATLRTERVGSGFTQELTDEDDVSIEIVSENAEAWNRYMEDLNQTHTTTVDNVEYTPDDNTVEMELEISSTQTFFYVEKPIRVELR